MIELLTTAEMAEADRLTMAAGTSGAALMERAGQAVADQVAARGDRVIAVVCGPGNNGGDGFVAARCLRDIGRSVRLLLVGEPDRLQGDAAEAAQRWSGSIERATPEGLNGVGVVVDALLGAGINRPVTGAMATLIEAINQTQVPVISVDLPSGVSGDSGAVMGVAVKATETVTFFRKKLGHLLMPGRQLCGAVKVADIGIADRVLGLIGPRTFENAPLLWRNQFPGIAISGHKYDRGHAIIVSGPLPSTGAAKLAARAALRVGAGLVTIAAPKNAVSAHAAESVAVMVREVDGAAGLAALLADPRLNTVVLGPGGGVGAVLRDQVAAALAREVGVVIDADAISSFAGDLPTLAAMIRSRPDRPVVLTPHAGEFSRLFNVVDQPAKLKSKLEQTKIAASESGAVVLFKGADTVIAHPDGRAAITANAPPTLATAGSGDVLAGMIAGLLAQGMLAFEAAAAAAWFHGEAANAFGGVGLISEDLPDMLPGVLQRLQAT